MIIGSHVSMSAPDYIVGAVKEALSYHANTLMIYTGAPQNTLRKDISLLKVNEARQLLKDNDIPFEHVVVHAPYIINLANTVNPSTYELAEQFLEKEIQRVQAIGSKYLVLHPGSSVGEPLETGIKSIVKGLNAVLKKEDDIIICLETMAGKGSEVGYKFEQIKQIIEGVTLKDKMGVCLDTCHVHDAGYDLEDFDKLLAHFDAVIGLDLLHVIHVNDSKNDRGAKKDRHENIGKGSIGFEKLYKIVHHPLLINKIKILETPWVDGKAPYKEEIEQLLGK